MRLDLILPVGISFYTFQTMSYTLDIYRGEMKSTRNFLDFALFVAFFPQLVAGPIERAKELLPQMSRPRTVTQQAFYSGCWLIFWGLWKKVVVADNLAYLADPVFRGSANASALQAYLGVTAFAGQIYCDFSGYSDIARGLARIMGFDLMRNFNLPYFAANPSDFWRRWHISLSTWLRDYLYIPLGGNRGSPLATYRNLFLTMFLGGLWHGASWNFAWWGIYHGLVLMGCRFISTVRPEWEKYRGGVRHFFNVFATYHVTLVGWLLFRATRRVMAAGGQMRDDGVRQILEMIGAWQNGLGFNATSLEMLKTLCFISLPLFIVQWLQHHTRDHYIMLRWRAPARIAFFAYLGWMWLLYGVQQGNAFIYFQF
jgi:D-alanyl-lipoteichoic acid acyltransferase DltB (MBOAT superfamily)